MHMRLDGDSADHPEVLYVSTSLGICATRKGDFEVWNFDKWSELINETKRLFGDDHPLTIERSCHFGFAGIAYLKTITSDLKMEHSRFDGGTMQRDVHGFLEFLGEILSPLAVFSEEDSEIGDKPLLAAQAHYVIGTFILIQLLKSFELKVF
jgi:hypothetical protein